MRQAPEGPDTEHVRADLALRELKELRERVVGERNASAAESDSQRWRPYPSIRGRLLGRADTLHWVLSEIDAAIAKVEGGTT